MFLKLGSLECGISFKVGIFEVGSCVFKVGVKEREICLRSGLLEHGICFLNFWPSKRFVYKLGLLENMVLKSGSWSMSRRNNKFDEFKIKIRVMGEREYNFLSWLIRGYKYN